MATNIGLKGIRVWVSIRFFTRSFFYPPIPLAISANSKLSNVFEPGVNRVTILSQEFLVQLKAKWKIFYTAMSSSISPYP